MDFSKLDANERLAIGGALAVIIAGLASSWGGLLLIAILAALGVLLVIFLPQMAPQTSLPGSKGSFITVLGGIAALTALVTTLTWIGFLAQFPVSALMLLVALAGALAMAWAGWQLLQAEGGRLSFGTAAGGSTTHTERAVERDTSPSGATAAGSVAATPTTTADPDDTAAATPLDEDRPEERRPEA